jgi:hypothetical protein
LAVLDIGRLSDPVDTEPDFVANTASDDIDPAFRAAQCERHGQDRL